MSNTLGRRQFLQSAVAGTAALASTLHAPRRVSAQALKTIRVTHFGGPYGALKDLVGVPFEQEKLGKVVYETDQPAIIVSKLQAQREDPPYHVVMMVRSFALRAANAGLLAPIRQADVPALAEVYPQAVLPGGMGVAMLVDNVDLMYDGTKTPAPLTSWLDLWRPELRGKVVLPAMPLGGLVTLTILSVARALGTGERSVDEAFKKFKELKPHVRTFFTDPNQASQLLERGEIAAAPQYGARISNLMKANAQVVRATPKEGIPAAPYDLCIAKGAPDQDVCQRYINFVISRRIQESIAATIFATPVHRQAKVPASAERFVVSDFSKLWFIDEEYVAAHQKEWTDRWVKEIQS